MSPLAEKSWFVKNTIYFPLRSSSLLQLIFYFVKQALGFLVNSLSTIGHRMGEREHDRVITQTCWLWQKKKKKEQQKEI